MCLVGPFRPVRWIRDSDPTPGSGHGPDHRTASEWNESSSLASSASVKISARAGLRTGSVQTMPGESFGIRNANGRPEAAVDAGGPATGGRRPPVPASRQPGKVYAVFTVVKNSAA